METIQDFESALGQYKQAVADKIGDLETRVVTLESQVQNNGDIHQAIGDVMSAMAELKGTVAIPPTAPATDTPISETAAASSDSTAMVEEPANPWAGKGEQ